MNAPSTAQGVGELRDDIVERLMRKQVLHLGPPRGRVEASLLNPDGPDAAAIITVLRAVYRAALTLCNNATDECRDDEQVLVPGDDLKALNDALDAVEEAEDA